MTAKKRILIVDDDQDLREMTRMVLERNGYEVETAVDSREGTTKAAAIQPDLILVDIVMEEVDAGLVFAETLGAQYPMLLISSIATSAEKVFDAHKLPVKGVLQKPVEPQRLLERVHAALADEAKPNGKGN